MLLEEIYSIVTEDLTVIAIMGTRFLPMRLSEDTVLPAAVYQRITTVPVTSFDGDSGLDLFRLQIKAWANTYTEAANLAIAIRSALDNASTIKMVTEFEQDDEDKETKSYSVIMQFSVWSTTDLLEETMPYKFEGDGVTTDFPFPSQFRSGSLQLFKNGVLAEEGVTYNEKADRSGVTFPVAPEGDPYKDKFAAFWE